MGNVELEQISEGRGRLRSRGGSPCPKRDEEISVLIECHITVHHAAETDRTKGLHRDVVILDNLFAKLPITLLQACRNIFETVRPDAIFIPVFPIIASRCDRSMILTDQHRLDASRAELDAKNGLSTLDCFLGIVSIHVHLR